jgi:hypothetical protein
MRTTNHVMNPPGVQDTEESHVNGDGPDVELHMIQDSKPFDRKCL